MPLKDLAVNRLAWAIMMVKKKIDLLKFFLALFFSDIKSFDPQVYTPLYTWVDFFPNKFFPDFFLVVPNLLHFQWQFQF